MSVLEMEDGKPHLRRPVMAPTLIDVGFLPGLPQRAVFVFSRPVSHYSGATVTLRLQVTRDADFSNPVFEQEFGGMNAASPDMDFALDVQYRVRAAYLVLGESSVWGPAAIWQPGV